uniref:Uncharacterized protein n=1 Tax=Pristhesancus plagipennis TaxID=1955184 RepID=A0A2K8JP48_PRIPG|nr:secreted hypothetical protein [Pristhesancus plagipennis]
MYLILVLLIILSANSSHSTMFPTRLIRTAVAHKEAQSPSLPFDKWPNDLDTASQVVFRPLFLTIAEIANYSFTVSSLENFEDSFDLARF